MTIKQKQQHFLITEPEQQTQGTKKSYSPPTLCCLKDEDIETGGSYVVKEGTGGLWSAAAS